MCVGRRASCWTVSFVPAHRAISTETFTTRHGLITSSEIPLSHLLAHSDIVSRSDRLFIYRVEQHLKFMLLAHMHQSVKLVLKEGSDLRCTCKYLVIFYFLISFQHCGLASAGPDPLVEVVLIPTLCRGRCRSGPVPSGQEQPPRARCGLRSHYSHSDSHGTAIPG